MLTNQLNDKYVPNGPWKVYWKSGQLYYKCTYSNGLRIGPFECYFESGVLWEKGFFINGNKKGYWLLHNLKRHYKGYLPKKKFYLT